MDWSEYLRKTTARMSFRRKGDNNVHFKLEEDMNVDVPKTCPFSSSMNSMNNEQLLQLINGLDSKMSHMIESFESYKVEGTNKELFQTRSTRPIDAKND